MALVSSGSAARSSATTLGCQDNQSLSPMSTKVTFGKLRHHTTRRRNLMNYLATRTLWPYNHCNVANLARNHRPFLNRMNLMKKLPVHSGCVNTICWNKTGEYILSGSDDRNLCITKPNYLFDSSKEYTVLHKVPTRHLGNVFSAQFMPNSGDSLIVSCSSEGPVIMHDINSRNPSDGLLNFNCHSSTIYEVVTVPDDDKIFLSCGEDKTIRIFDIRVHSSCGRASTCPHPALIRNSLAMTTLTLHPLNSNLLLVGRADGLGLVYDRRKLPDVTRFSREQAHSERLAGIKPTFPNYVHPREGVVSQFTVPDMDEKYRFTSLCFNSDGSEVLASYSGDYVYLFNHDRSSNLELIQTLPKKPEESNNRPTNDNGTTGNDSTNANGAQNQNRRRSGRPVTEITRIRVRGDWSDTGINSVPRARQRQSESSNVDDNEPAAALWQQIAEVASRRSGDRPRFIPISEMLAYNSPNGQSNDPLNALDRHQNQAAIEEEEEEDDENSTVVDEDENMNNDRYNDSDEDDDDDDDDDEDYEDYDSFERFADITVEGLLRDATVRLGHDTDTSSSVNRGGNEGDSSDASDQRRTTSAQTRAKFQRAADNLRNKCNQIPTYHPRVKYQGHRNSRTSIKEAIFWGDDYIMSGSDCGRIMIWEKATARILTAFPADERVVNCLSPNPHHYVLASSGIDYDIKLWSTQSLLGEPLKVSPEDMQKIVEINELMLEESKQTISVPPHLFFRVLASLAHSNHN